MGSQRYGMKLNHHKCELLALRTKAKIHFRNGAEVPKFKDVIYLGANIDPKGYKAELEGRLRKANTVFYKLKTFWRNTSCDNKWKLQVFNACAMSVLLYGLEGIVLTQSLKQRINYFYTKAIRNILRIPAAFMSRISNDKVIDIANNILHGEEHKDRYMIASNMIKMRAVGFLGHIAREAQQWGHVARVTVNAYLSRFSYDHRRVGRPRFSWINTTMEKAHRLIYKRAGETPPDFDIGNQSHRQKIHEKANAREFTFNKKKAMKVKRTKPKPKTGRKQPEQPQGNHEREFWHAYFHSHGWPWTAEWTRFFRGLSDKYEQDEFGTYCNSRTGETVLEERTRLEKEILEIRDKTTIR